MTVVRMYCMLRVRVQILVCERLQPEPAGELKLQTYPGISSEARRCVRSTEYKLQTTPSAVFWNTVNVTVDGRPFESC